MVPVEEARWGTGEGVEWSRDPAGDRARPDSPGPLSPPELSVTCRCAYLNYRPWGCGKSRNVIIAGGTHARYASYASQSNLWLQRTLNRLRDGRQNQVAWTRRSAPSQSDSLSVPHPRSRDSRDVAVGERGYEKVFACTPCASGSFAWVCLSTLTCLPHLTVPQFSTP